MTNLFQKLGKILIFGIFFSTVFISCERQDDEIEDLENINQVTVEVLYLADGSSR